MKKLFKYRRTFFFILSDFFLFFLSLYFISFILKVNIPTKIILVLSIIKIFTLYIFNSYHFIWRFFSIEDLVKTGFALLVSEVIVFFILFLYNIRIFNKFPTYLIFLFLDFIISFFFISFLRLSKRIYLLFFEKSLKETLNNKNRKNLAIIGAGEAGEQIVRSLKKNNNYNILFFLDDDEDKIGKRIHNVPILGRIEDIKNLKKIYKIDSVLIAIPSLSKKRLREIFLVLKNAGINDIKIVPDIKSYEKEISEKDIKNISFEDLLKREPVKIDLTSLKAFFKNKTILVTGGAGSIGSEIVRQLVKLNPKRIIALDINESGLYNLEQEVKKILEKENNKDTLFEILICDIKDINKLKHIFKSYNFDIVFHAAAYKHVPLMEIFPEEAVKTNIFGTYNLAKCAVEYNVKKFINISTDKAVNPTNVMGATKRFAEFICSAFNKLNKTKFISVRFGNVLGSRGSVVPLFLNQIKSGGPITITHPEIKRYFMTIPEAVLLVLQASVLGKGGEIFVLNMGEPVKILDLAFDLIKFHGLEPYKDIDIIFTGLRPGEKLYEELFNIDEEKLKSPHEKIFIAKPRKEHYSIKEIKNAILKLLALAYKFDKKGIKNLLKDYIKNYKPKN